MPSLAIVSIKTDEGTQARAEIDPAIVSKYADDMKRGDTFPPIVVFVKPAIIYTQYWLADGFHRLAAAKTIGRETIEVDIHVGTREDALWYAIGANQKHGQPRSYQDLTKACELAIMQWPRRVQREVAAHIGCSSSLVSKVAARMAARGVAVPLRGRAGHFAEKAKDIEPDIREGKLTQEQMAKKHGVSQGFVHGLRVKLGFFHVEKTLTAVRDRRETMREMAVQGFSTPQIAQAVGLKEDSARSVMRRANINPHADTTVGHHRRHDSNRIVERIVMDAENLVEGIKLIDFARLDQDRLPEWIGQLQGAREQLGGFIRRLMKERKSHGDSSAA